MKADVVRDTTMRLAFQSATTTAPHGKLRRKVVSTLKTNRGRIFSRGWHVNRKRRVKR